MRMRGFVPAILVEMTTTHEVEKVHLMWSVKVISMGCLLHAWVGLRMSI